MDISARSYLTAGISLTAATAIAFAPLAVPPSHHIDVHHVGIQHTDIRLTATPSDVVGLPGQALIGVVDNIVTLIDVVFTGLIDATDDPTLAASLSILETLSSDAFAKLAENLGLANEVIMSTTEEVGVLLATALTGSGRGVPSGRLVAENVLQAVQAVGEAAFELVRIAVSEVTFQVHNLASGVGALVDQLGAAASTPPKGVTVTTADEDPAIEEIDEVDEAPVTDEADEAPVIEEVGEETVVDKESALEVFADNDAAETTTDDEPAENEFTENESTDEPTENEPTENEPTENEPTENGSAAGGGVNPAESR